MCNIGLWQVANVDLSTCTVFKVNLTYRSVSDSLLDNTH